MKSDEIVEAIGHEDYFELRTKNGYSIKLDGIAMAILLGQSGAWFDVFPMNWPHNKGPNHSVMDAEDEFRMKLEERKGK